MGNGKTEKLFHTLTWLRSTNHAKAETIDIILVEVEDDFYPLF